MELLEAVLIPLGLGAFFYSLAILYLWRQGKEAQDRFDEYCQELRTSSACRDELRSLVSSLYQKMDNGKAADKDFDEAWEKMQELISKDIYEVKAYMDACIGIGNKRKELGLL